MWARLSANHLVGLVEQQWRNGNSECIGGSEIDDKLEFCRLLDGKFTWLLAFENPVNVHGRPATDFQGVCSVRQKRSRY